VEQRLLTISDAAALAGRSVTTLRIWEQKGILKPLRDSRGRRLYRPDQVRRVGSRVEELRAARSAPRPRVIGD
jgi:MerR family transcriptional regulator, heat shock protein HspR